MQNWDSETYSKNSALQYKGALNFLSEYTSLFKEQNLNILDIGCGDGKITREMSSVFYKSNILGIDHSASMIEFASKNNSNGEKLSFREGDASRLKFNEEFDLIVSFYCLQWITNKKKLFEQINKALKTNGGMALLLMPVIYPPYFQIRERMLQDPKWKYHATNYDITSHKKFSDSNYIQYAIDAGLNIIKAEVIPEKFVFKSKEEFCNFLEPILPHFLQSDQNAKKTFISELVELYKAHDQSDQWMYKYYIYRLVARKGPWL